MAVPDILFHPKGVFVNNLHKLFQEPDSDEDDIPDKARFLLS